MIIHDLEQGSQGWFNIRLGLPTASNFNRIVTSKGDLSNSNLSYMYELIAEHLIKEKEDFAKNHYMERGNELEDNARAMYSLMTDNEVEEVGIITNDEITVGASPDGLIGDNGGLEIKCPKSSTLVKYLLKGELPTEYKLQVMGNLWLSEREWWDFFAYHPKIKPFYLRVYRDEEFIKKMSKKIIEFTKKLQENLKKIKD